MTRSEGRVSRILFVPGYRDLESPIMMARLLKTDDLWWQNGGRYDRIIVSGGVTKPRQCISEAEFMKNWLVRHARVAPEDIVTECFSQDSFESVRNVVEKHLRDDAARVKVTIVSQQGHARRLKVTFEAHQVTHVGIVPVPGYSILRRIFEWGYLYYTLYDPKGESWFSRWKAARTRNALEGF